MKRVMTYVHHLIKLYQEIKLQIAERKEEVKEHWVLGT